MSDEVRLGPVFQQAKPLFAPDRTRGCTFLRVPYARREEAKRLGAFWSPERKHWFIPRHITDHQPFIDAGFLAP